MSKRIYGSLSKNGALMEWAEQKGYVPPETVDSLNIQIWDTESEIWHYEQMLEENKGYAVEDDLVILYALRDKLIAERTALEALDGWDDDDIHSVILYIRPAGAADE